jgi:DNA-binding NarL/FixJ family response regulator
LTAVRVLVADDQPVVRTGFRYILQGAGIEVVGEAADGVEAVALARRREADLVLMDARMPRMDGIAATRMLAGPDAPRRVEVLVVTTFDHDEYVFGALRAGAAGFLLKDTSPEELVAAVRQVVAGGGVVAPQVVRRLLVEFAGTSPRLELRAEAAELTAREREVLELVASGASNVEISARLVLEESTVKSHVSSLLTKLRLRNRVQLVIFAYESGLVRVGRPLPA